MSSPPTIHAAPGDAAPRVAAPSGVPDARSVLRYVYLARFVVATAIFVAAVLTWRLTEPSQSLLASLAITVTMIVTAGSALYSEIYRKPLGAAFLAAQPAFDLVLVSVIVHVTGGADSQFAAMFILVIAGAALLLPVPGVILTAAAACLLYFGDVLLVRDHAVEAAVWLQLGVFAAVALGCAVVAARLRATRAEALAAHIAKVRLQAADILRNIRSGIVTVDRSGRLLYANPAASTLLGADLDQQLGHMILPVIRGAAPELARALERAAFEGVRATRVEGTITVGERRFPIGMNTTCSDGGADGTATATAIFQDISDQKRLDTLHLRAERLEGVAELSASLAHEIKNPLAAIRSAVELLGRSPRSTPDEQSLTGLIVRESDRLSRLLTEFLDFARVRVTRIGHVNLNAIARGAAGLAAAHPDRHDGVDVQCIAPAEDLLIEADEDLLHRAVFNLTLNAVQASPAGGRVRVELAALAVDQTPAGISFDRGGVALRVSDEGPGIPPEIRDRLFDPFFTTKPGGSGLGLPVVHRAIEAHRGFVFVDSDERGTRVTVLLPCVQSETGELQ